MDVVAVEFLTSAGVTHAGKVRKNATRTRCLVRTDTGPVGKWPTAMGWSRSRRSGKAGSWCNRSNAIEQPEAALESPGTMRDPDFFRANRQIMALSRRAANGAERSATTARGFCWFANRHYACVWAGGPVGFIGSTAAAIRQLSHETTRKSRTGRGRDAVHAEVRPGNWPNNVITRAVGVRRGSRAGRSWTGSVDPGDAFS